MDQVIAQGKFLQLVQRQRWEFVRRHGASGVVVVIPRTQDGRWLLIEQHREPVAARCIEFPAGLAGDAAEYVGEPLTDAAQRELVEETGYQAAVLLHLGRSAPTPGLTCEIMDYFLANDVQQIEAGGGVGGEDIQSHLISDDEIDAWLEQRARTHIISSMVYCGLYLARAHRPTR